MRIEHNSPACINKANPGIFRIRRRNKIVNTGARVDSKPDIASNTSTPRHLWQAHARTSLRNDRIPAEQPV